MLALLIVAILFGIALVPVLGSLRAAVDETFPK
jgi:hypothetical protein